ncbi:polysaccharide deacetylase [uncultured Bacteroides sp.]|uniref:polysaccharide deacetylase n=1 Tax=uncultured Bacteroides sp. TaxID=162156 RepID=UPI0025F57702|nr:polysaccharide deacetylase [uncultured Bacteroides sp.]
MKSPNESIAFSSWEGRKMQLTEQKTCIVVGIANPRTRLRVSVLLSTVPDYQVRYITTEEQVSEMIEEADMIIGTGIIAREGVMHRKPVIVLGDYGFGGLVTPNTFRSHFNNCFRGKNNGMKDDYFSLDKLEGEIKKAFNLTYQELQMMSNQTLTFLNT